MGPDGIIWIKKGEINRCIQIIIINRNNYTFNMTTINHILMEMCGGDDEKRSRILRDCTMKRDDIVIIMMLHGIKFIEMGVNSASATLQFKYMEYEMKINFRKNMIVNK